MWHEKIVWRQVESRIEDESLFIFVLRQQMIFLLIFHLARDVEIIIKKNIIKSPTIPFSKQKTNLKKSPHNHKNNHHFILYTLLTFVLCPFKLILHYAETQGLLCYPSYTLSFFFFSCLLLLLLLLFKFMLVGFWCIRFFSWDFWRRRSSQLFKIKSLKMLYHRWKNKIF